MSYDLNKWVANDFRRRLRRHRFVPIYLALMMVISAINAVLEAFDDGLDTDILPNSSPFLMTIVIAMLLSPFARDTWVGGRTEAAFDEFERAALGRATTRAYAVTLLLMIAALAWCSAASLYGWPMPSTPLDWSTIAIAFLTIGAALPICLAELMVPLPPEGEEDEA